MWVGILGCAYRSPRPPLPQPTDPRTVEDLSANLKPYQQKDWRHVPRFLTPLKPHTVTRAFLGNLRPTVTLYKGHVNITANSKFWYNSTSSVCTIVIPTCTLKASTPCWWRTSWARTAAAPSSPSMVRAPSRAPAGLEVVGAPG